MTPLLAQIPERLADLAGTSQWPGWWALVAGVLIVLGTSIVLLIAASSWLERVRAEHESDLLPTLARDVLDADLRKRYHRSLELDDRAASRLQAALDEGGTAVAKKIRRTLIQTQARRFEALRSGNDPPANTAPKLNEIDDLLEEAAAVLDAPDSPDRALQEKLEALADQIDERLLE